MQSEGQRGDEKSSNDDGKGVAISSEGVEQALLEAAEFFRMSGLEDGNECECSEMMCLSTGEHFEKNLRGISMEGKGGTGGDFSNDSQMRGPFTGDLVDDRMDIGKALAALYVAGI
jgi:hypothetical protein